MKLERYTDEAPVEYMMVDPGGEWCHYDDALAQWEEQRKAKDLAYWERNMLVAVLAKMFPSKLFKTDIPGWLPEWHHCVFIQLPSGKQVSYHFHDRELPMFEGIPWAETNPWDGHSNPTKYQRLADFGEGVLKGRLMARL